MSKELSEVCEDRHRQSQGEGVADGLGTSRGRDPDDASLNSHVGKLDSNRWPLIQSIRVHPVPTSRFTTCAA